MLAFSRFAIILVNRPQARRRLKSLEGKSTMPQGLWSVILLGAFILFFGASVMGWAVG